MMDTEAAGSPFPPAPPSRARTPGSIETAAAAWTRSFFSHPSWVAAALAATGALGIASAIPSHHWPHPLLVLLIVGAGVAAVNSVMRLVIGERLPPWSLQVDVGLGNLFVSLVAVTTAREHVDTANLYLLVVFFAILYLPPRSALAHTAIAGAVYGVLLGLRTAPVEAPVVAWLSVFGTAAVLGAVVFGTVSVLRVTARVDPLTGLANRRMWDERLEEELERARRSGTTFSVAMVDLDDFKAVNDAGGHQAGDHLIRDLGAAWHAVIRGGGDFLARLGGDEFGLLAPGADEIAIRLLARRLTDAVPSGVAASIGVATWDRAESASDLLRRADRLMYQVKQRRRCQTP